MTLDEIQDEIRELPPEELSKLITYALHIKKLRDPETIEKLNRRNTDKDPSKWLTPDQFEAHLESL